MKLEVTLVDVWISKLKDSSGKLAEKLEILGDAGVDLDFLSARRSHEIPGTGVAFIAPIKGAKQAAAAKKAGFKKTKRLFAIRVSGPNKPGMGAAITSAIANVDVSLKGFVAAVIGKKFLLHVALDNAADAAKSIRAIKKL